jgi:hypothetical protein
MTLEHAIQRGRALDFSARENYPMSGYNAEAVKAEAAEILATIDRAVAAVAACDRAGLAASIKQKLDGKAFRAGVAPRKTA